VVVIGGACIDVLAVMQLTSSPCPTMKLGWDLFLYRKLSGSVLLDDVRCLLRACRTFCPRSAAKLSELIYRTHQVAKVIFCDHSDDALPMRAPMQYQQGCRLQVGKNI